MINDRKLQDNNYNYHQQYQTNRNFRNLYNEGNMINSESVTKYLYVCIFV